MSGTYEMSVPSIRGKVERYKNIKLTYYNENGEKIVKQLILNAKIYNLDTKDYKVQKWSELE